MEDKNIEAVLENPYVTERETLIEKFSSNENQALNRIAQKMSENEMDVIRDYSRTYHRHARSHTRR